MGGNFKAKCLDTNGYCGYTKGKIYKIRDGKFTYDDFDTMVARIDTIGDLDRNSGAIWELIKEEGENKMEDLKKLLKVGYVVKFEDDNLSKIEINNYGELSFSGGHWFPLERLKSDLTYSDMKIVEIYGRCSSNEDAWKLSTKYRKLIWKRTEISPTQLKLEELEKKQREIADEMEKLRKEL